VAETLGDAALSFEMADLQDLPEVIPLLVEHVERTTSDAVFADRTGHHESSPRCRSSAIPGR
jgi:hypothetical protein